MVLDMTTQWPVGSFYSDSKGGHAHDDLREAFFDAIDALEHWEAGEAEPMVELRNHEVPISQVFKLLLTCTDALASEAWEWFVIGDTYLEPNESIDTTDTYGRASRWLLEVVADTRRSG
jgi:hypothetical protein